VDCDETGGPLGWLAEALGATAFDPTMPVEPEMAVRQGKFLVPRLLHWARSGQLPMPRTDDYVLAPTERGAIDNLRLTQAQVDPPAANEVQVRIEAAGLNFRDVLNVLGLYPGDPGPIGGDLCGIVTALGAEVTGFEIGQRVMGFMQGAFASRVNVPSLLLAPVPDGVDAVGAATLPAAALTARLAFDWAKLKSGDRVLVHAASGGVGLAAIQLARHLGAVVFATASAHKQATLREMGVAHVYDSRTTDFADQILADTDGAGVDVVLNSLAGEAINRNLRVLKPFGRFLELGKRDFYENTRIGLRPFRNNISYFGIDADQLMSERPQLTRRLFGELMSLFADGVLKPLPFRAFPADEVVDAFRYMQQSKQIGKVVVSFRGGVPTGVPRKADAATLALPADASYLVTGGLGGFGLKTAQWLASKGARHIVLLGRRGMASPEAKAAVSALEASGIEVRVHACDVTRRKALADVLRDIAATMPPLRGVVHAAMVIDDGLLRNQDEDAFHRVLAPKVLGARHLHELTRALRLDFFVLYSSATTLFGNPGQGNYVAANLYLEALAERRRAQGLPAICLSWGAIDDVGYLARHQEVKDALQSRMGGPALHSGEALQVLEQMLLRDQSGLGVMDLEWSALRRFLPTAAAPKFEELARHAEDLGGDGEGVAEIRRLLEELGPEELHTAFVDLLKREVAEILRISPERLDENRSMYDQGMDSLMGMELVAAVEERFGINLPIMALSEGPTIARLVERIIRQLRAPDAEAQDDASGLSEQVRSMAARHVGEADQAAIDEVAAAVERGKSDGKGLLSRP